MTRTIRIASILGIAIAVFGATYGSRESASAALPYTVTATATQPTVAVGSTAVFVVKVEGQTAALPSFSYDVEGGTLAAITSLDPTAANVAEGAVFVTSDSEGTARLTVRFGGEVLATGEARFARMGRVSVAVTLDAGPDAAARTWRYEVVSASGQVVASLDANTSGDSPTSRVSSPALPFGPYTVRQVLGSDTRTVCAAGVFYEAASPVSTIELAANEALVQFTIRPCPSLPANLGVLIPIDTLAPAGAAADFPAGQTPISEVRGARDEGPGAAATPLPPRAGDSPARQSNSSNLSLLLLLLGAAATVLPAAALSAGSIRRDANR
jgi:hypothetical protein